MKAAEQAGVAGARVMLESDEGKDEVSMRIQVW